MKTCLEHFVNIPVFSGSVDAAISALYASTKEGRCCHVVTLNAEMLLCMSRSTPVREAIMDADFFVCDSVAVWLWFRLHKKQATRIPGIDLAEALMHHAILKHESVALVGGRSEYTHTRAKEFWAKRGAQVVLHERGPRIELTQVPDAKSKPSPLNQTFFGHIRAAQPHLVYVGFGHGKQEWWIAHAKTHIHTPTIFIGVGGALDVWSGEVVRAPRIVRTLWLEWLWRLACEPWRIKRIFHAVVVFPVRALIDFLVY